MKIQKENFVLPEDISTRTPEEKVESLKKAIVDIGFEIEETVEGIRIFEMK